MSVAAKPALQIRGPQCTELLIPSNERERLPPVVSIVVPALNEALTIAEFIVWCWDGLTRSGVPGEIIIIDSSSDETSLIALEHGARVVRTPKRGLGQAYIDAIPYIRGELIIMGDCDLTYDFRELKNFVESYKAGNEFVMGSRFKGQIEEGAMPLLHRYFGTPVTTWILNRIYGSHFSDIHCGMRAVTKAAFIKMNLTSSGWEYASEMVLKAKCLELAIDEVPVVFYKDREGRESHHRRNGWWSPWLAGWDNIKVMLIYNPKVFLINPGFFFTIIGLILTVILAFGPLSLGSIELNIHWMLLGVTFMILGFSLFQTGVVANIFNGAKLGLDKIVPHYLHYNWGVSISIIMIILGILVNSRLLYSYIYSGFKLTVFSNTAIAGLALIMLGVQLFGFTLVIELTSRLQKRVKRE